MPTIDSRQDKRQPVVIIRARPRNILKTAAPTAAKLLPKAESQPRRRLSLPGFRLPPAPESGFTPQTEAPPAAEVVPIEAAPAPEPDTAKPLPKQLNRKARLNLEACAAAKWLKDTFPSLFSEPPKPLAIGIGEELFAQASAAGHRRSSVGTAITRWVRSPRYLQQVARPGAVRWGLDGTAVDFVTSEHQADARKLLAEHKAAAKRRPRT